MPNPRDHEHLTEALSWNRSPSSLLIPNDYTRDETMTDQNQNGGRGEAKQETANLGNARRGYGEGGDTAFGQMAEGSSNRVEGGYGGDNAGGFGQQVMNSQWGQGGPGPLTQGAGYGQGGGQFGPAGQDSQSARSPVGPTDQGRGGGSYGQQDYSPAAQRSEFRENQRYAGPGQEPSPSYHNDHEPHYRHWRDTQLASHDRDYARWRDEQARKYDEDYHGWRSERHSTFRTEFEGWRTNRGGQSSGSTQAESPVGKGAHGANTTLANIADGETGSHRKPDAQSDVKETP